jgi:hypothetical protein
MQRSVRDAVLGANQLYENLLGGTNNCTMRRYIRTPLVKIFCEDKKKKNTVLEAVPVAISEFRISHGLLCKVTKLRTLL